MYICIYTALTCTFDVAAFLEIFGTRPKVDTRGKGYAPAIQTVPFRDPSCMGFSALFIYNTDPQAGWGLGGVFLLEVQYSVLKSLISTCVLSYVGSRKERIGYLTESASLKRTAGIV